MRNVVACFFLLVCNAHAMAAAIERIDTIRTTAREFALAQLQGDTSNVEVTVGRLDPRLRLHACERPLTAYLTPGSRVAGHTSIGVRCDGAKPWALFVPVHINRHLLVAVATDPMPRGHIINPGDISFESRSTGKLHGGYFIDDTKVIGKITTRPIAGGGHVAPNMLKAPIIVRRGERITLSLSTGAVAVRVAGEALRNGAMGDRIPVKNLSSKRVIEGVIHGDGLVLIGRRQ